MATRKPITRWLIAAAVLIFFIVVMIVLDLTMNLDDVAKWVLRIGFVVLGLIAAGSVLWYLRPQDEEPVLDPGDDILLTIGGARARLPRKSFASRAVVLVVGPEGSTKTTLVARSGGDPELLGGDPPAKGNDAPVPTKTANVWAMQQAVVVELTGKLLTDSARWTKVVRALRAPRVAAAVGKGEPDTRAAVVCVPCDLFYSGNNGQQLATLGVSLRQRLAEAARELGLAMPVYVVFTKADRIPHFESWISPFTKDELRAPLGATLPFDAASTTANYAERLTPRIDAAFREIVDSLSARRVDLLGRDTVIERRYAAYELPRELRKLAPAVSAFLLELCRPTQLGTSPLLRGFYFVGARPVVVTDVAQAAAVRQAPAPSASDATSIFRQASAAPASPIAAQQASSRKVPEWVFLDTLLRQVVLADTGAASVAGGGVRVQTTRRLMLGAAIAASLLVLLGATTSWIGNRMIANRIDTAARAVATLPDVRAEPGTIAFPSPEALRKLDALRAQLDTVRGYVKDGPPIRLRFLLWQGPALIDAARPVWYEGFRRQLFATSWGAIVDSLKALPELPTAANDYGTTYGWLKGYLITTSAPERSTVDFLAPVLLTSWQRGQQTDEDVTALAQRQFEFYASELPTFNPFPKPADNAVVTQGREFLARFTGGEQIYRNMLDTANKAIKPVPIPQTPGVLTAVKEVPGAFSAKGFAFMADAFRNSDRYFQGETWVVGDATASKGIDREAVISAIRTRYTDDYTKAWRGVIASAVVVRPSSVADAAKKLETFSGNQSPILQVLRTTATNTNTDSITRLTFQPVHAVTPPEIVDKFVSEKNQPYQDGLLNLMGALNRVANLPQPQPNDTAATMAIVQAAQLAGGDVTNAKVAEKRVAQGFTLTPLAAPSANAVDRLMLEPINGAEAVLRVAGAMKVPTKRVSPPPPPPPPPGGGITPPPPQPAGVPLAQVLNDLGSAFCTSVRPVMSKFPFNADATADATMEEVTALLAPNDGALFMLANNRSLKPLLEEKDGKWAGKAADGIELSPAFVAFFNRAAEVSRALFPDGGSSPSIRWLAEATITPETPLVELQFGTRRASFNSATPANLVSWPQGREAQLDATFKKNKPIVVSKGSGDWALFRMALPAKFEGTKGTWPATGKDAVPVVVEFAPQRGGQYPVLQRGWLGRGMQCVPQVTK